MRCQKSVGIEKCGCRWRSRRSGSFDLSREFCHDLGECVSSERHSDGISFSTFENYFHLQSSREQLAIAEFARSLLIIPKTLATNAAQDATDLVAKLRAYHNSSQTKKEHANLKWYVVETDRDSSNFMSC